MVVFKKRKFRIWKDFVEKLSHVQVFVLILAQTGCLQANLSRVFATPFHCITTSTALKLMLGKDDAFEVKKHLKIVK